MDDPRALALAAIKSAQAALQAAHDTLSDPWAAIDATGGADVTGAVQAAVDQTGKVPAGRYLVDAVKGLTIRAGTKVEMDANAVLVVKPNGAPKYACVTVEADAQLIGGQIIGDRLVHDYSSGGTHEWGYGIKIIGDRAQVSGTRVSRCTGDGIIVSADDVTLDGVVSTQNRRQGMSVFDAKRPKCYRCEFSETGDLLGNPGTAPKAGVDIEPDSGSCEGAEFHDCIWRGNATSNLLLWTRSGTSAAITGAKVVGGSMSGAPNGINARSNNGAPITLFVDGCAIQRGSGSGIRADQGSVVEVVASTFSGPSDRADFTLTGTDTRTKYDLASLNGGVIKAGTNRYT